jgi:asparagine synthase (glutamine-hydrolysing)
MCGIAGVAGHFSSEEGLSSVDKMIRSIRHRGPDDEGSWAAEGFAFGMCRLSIIDLTGGHQPMFSDEGVSIVFNGEIYNYRQLRCELKEKGFEFSTQSDTEVILNTYLSEGIAGIQRLEGMFGICLYDPRIKTVFLIRDRVGIKPLYYGWIGGRFYFSSEIKAMLAAVERKPEINLQSVYHYMTFRYVPGPETIWRGIKKLQPGHYLSLNLSTLKSRTTRYWCVSFKGEMEEGRNYEKEFERLFLDAVQSHLVVSDVPVGVLLSGGLDSSAVVAAAVELGHNNFHTFSIGFNEEGDDYNESRFAREMAGHVKSQHHEMTISQKEFIDFLPEFVKISDEPLADLASIPLYYVCRLAAEHVKVALAGEGSDEILGGYHLDWLAWKMDMLNIMTGWIPDLIWNMSPQWMKRWSTRHRLATCRTHMPTYWSDAEKERLWRSLKPEQRTSDMIGQWYQMALSTDPIEQFQQIHCGSWLVEDLLMKADKMSMASSLELRVPFLTHPLVEWAATLPREWKVGSRANGYTSKKILRRFAAKRIPHSIIKRRKQGFPVPAYHWLRGKMYWWAQDLLLNKNAFTGDWFNKKEISLKLHLARQGDLSSAHKVWALIILEHWLKCWAN